MKLEAKIYETPSIKMLEIHVEGVLAASTNYSNSTFSDATAGEDLEYESIW